MRLTIDGSVLALFPEVAFWAPPPPAASPTGARTPLPTGDLRRAEAALPAKLLAGTPRRPSTRASQLWREAYRRFGAKPKDHPSSVENLVRRVLKGWTVPHVNRLVDIYNAVSLETLLPAGAEDLDAIEGDVELALAAGERAAGPAPRRAGGAAAAAGRSHLPGPREARSAAAGTGRKRTARS